MCAIAVVSSDVSVFTVEFVTVLGVHVYEYYVTEYMRIFPEFSITKRSSGYHSPASRVCFSSVNFFGFC